MSFVNVGAWSTDTGDRIPTKKALREALTSAPAAVVFDKTSIYDSSDLPSEIHGDRIPSGVKLTVVGPDPFRSRKWYATVEMVNGKAKVS